VKHLAIAQSAYVDSGSLPDGSRTAEYGVDSRRYQICREAVGLERGPLSPCEDI
jgi:hypothetical protein